MQERTTPLENRVSQLEDTVPLLAIEIKVTPWLNAIDIKVEDLENCLHCDNVRVVGIPEKAEGNDPVEFAEHWLRDIFGKETFSALFAVLIGFLPDIHYLGIPHGHFLFVS